MKPVLQRHVCVRHSSCFVPRVVLRRSPTRLPQRQPSAAIDICSCNCQLQLRLLTRRDGGGGRRERGRGVQKEINNFPSSISFFGRQGTCLGFRMFRTSKPTRNLVYGVPENGRKLYHGAVLFYSVVVGDDILGLFIDYWEKCRSEVT